MAATTRVTQGMAVFAKCSDLVGRVFLGDRHINAELIEDGVAWVYRQYSDDSHLLRLEAQAREKGRGLWGLPAAQRIPPWVWRKQRRAGNRDRVDGQQ